MKECFAALEDQTFDHGPIWPKIKLVGDFMAVLVTCKYDKDPIKNEIAILRTTFSPLWELSVAVETRVLINPPQNLMLPFPTQMML